MQIIKENLFSCDVQDLICASACSLDFHTILIIKFIYNNIFLRTKEATTIRLPAFTAMKTEKIICLSKICF